MHEYSVIEQIIKIANQTARDHNAAKVTRIGIVVGEQSGLVDGSLQMYFTVLAQGTACSEAVLEIEPASAQWFCPLCKRHFTRQPTSSFFCPECGRDGQPSSLGKEYYLKDIEIENA